MYNLTIEAIVLNTRNFSISVPVQVLLLLRYNYALATSFIYEIRPT